MDLQTGLIYVGVVVISAAVILLVSMFGIKEKSYEEAIAEQRKLPDDLLLGKKDKSKDKKHKSKTGKKVKEKKEEKDDKDDKPEHVQFEETPQILSPETNIQDICKGSKKKIKAEKVKPILLNKDESPVVVPESNALNSPLVEVNHFDVIQPKDELELVRSQSKENLRQISQSELIVTKSPKGTPIKSKKNIMKESVKKKEEIKEEKKEATASMNIFVQPLPRDLTKELKEPQKEIQKEVVSLTQSINKETNNKKNKKKNDILAQIGGDKDGINISLLMPLVQKAELSRSETQILIEQLLNKQQDNPMEHSEWTEGRADPTIKLKKQLAEKEKALIEEHDASVTFQNKLKELRAELNSERSRLTATVKQLEESLNSKVTEAQTLHTRMQHIFESHAAEKQGYARQIEQLQTKVNEDAAIIHKMKEDQGQTQGHLQQELMAQRKQLDVQYAQMHENENALKAQLAKKHVEYQELQNVNMSITQELQATCESSNAEIEMLRQQLAIMREQLMHSEGHLKEAECRFQDVVRQLEESRRATADLDHRLKNTHRHEQELQKQVHNLQAELKMVKAEANEASALTGELSKVQSELMKLKSDAAEVMNLRGLLNSKDDEIKKLQLEMTQSQQDSSKSQSEMKKLETVLNENRNELSKIRTESTKARDELKHERNELKKVQDELKIVKEKLSQVQDELNKSETSVELKLSKSELEQMQNGDKISSSTQLQISKLQEDNDRLVAQLDKFSEMQKEVIRLHEENESLLSRINTIDNSISAEGRENGVEKVSQKDTVQQVEHSHLLEQKDKQLENLKAELMSQQAEFDQFKMRMEILQRDANNQNNITKRLQDDLETQRSKNDELRTKNWKVMEALSAAESRVKSNCGSNIDEHIYKIKMTEQEATKSLLQRIFPDVTVTETSYDKWLKTFEDRVHAVITENKNKETPDALEIERQNNNLQNLVAHYKKIIMDTEGMLNNLQNYVESEESRWKADLRQKENEVHSLRIELQELNKKTHHDKFIHSQAQNTDGVEFAFNCMEKSLPTITKELQEKISQLELRLKEDEVQMDHKADLVKVTTTHTSPIKNINFINVEQLQEEKQQLSQDLETERNKNVTLDAELNKLRLLVEKSEQTLNQGKNIVSQCQNEVTRLEKDGCGAGSGIDQCAINGPPTDSSNSKSASTLKTTSKRRRFAGWFRKKVTARAKLR